MLIHQLAGEDNGTIDGNETNKTEGSDLLFGVAKIQDDTLNRQDNY